MHRWAGIEPEPEGAPATDGAEQAPADGDGAKRERIVTADGEQAAQSKDGGESGEPQPAV
jgi:hypothetical protein